MFHNLLEWVREVINRDQPRQPFHRVPNHESPTETHGRSTDEAGDEREVDDSPEPDSASQSPG